MRRAASLFGLVTLVATVALFGVQGASAQHAGAFARSGLGVRGPSLGNAMAADDRAGAFYNPALAPFAAGQNVSMSVTSRPFDRQDQSIQFSTPQARRAGFAIGLLRSAVTGIDGRDNGGFHTGSLSTDEFAGFLAFGLRLGSRVTGGLSLQAFRSDLYDGLDPVSTIGIDFGFTAAVSDHVRLALVLDDLLARYTWDTTGLYADGGKSTTDNFPRRLRLAGAGVFLDGRLRLLGEWEASFASVEAITRTVSLLGDRPVEFVDREDLVLREGLFRAGVEARPVDVLQLRLGLDRTRGGGYRPGFGLGLHQRLANLTLEFDYAYLREPFGVGAAHSAGLTLFLDRK